MGIKELEKKIKEDAKNHGVSLLLSKENSVSFNGIACNGYFMDTPKPTLAVACGKDEKDWIPTLVHEYCHMRQWIEKSPFWDQVKVGDKEAMDFIDDWLNKKIELSDSDLTSYINASLEVELDCEKRVIEKIKEYNLDIDPIEYTQKSLSYVLFYHCVKSERQWYEMGREPYSIKEVFSNMPKSFDEVDVINPPKELISLIKKHCLKESK